MFGFRKKVKKQASTKKARTRQAYYSSATSSMLNRLSIVGDDIDNIIESQYIAIQNRARHGFCNNDYIAGFINQACINIIGSAGIKIQSKTQNDELNKKIENYFKKWSKKGNCEVTGNMSFLDIQLMCVKSLLRDGEFFIVKNVIDNKLELQLIEPSNIDVSYKATLSNSRKVINGIEVNQFGKATAYYITQEDNTRKRIPRDRMIHGFIQNFIGQKRGISAVATALIRLGLLGQFETSAIDNARQSAKIMAFASKPVNEYEPPLSSFDDEEVQENKTEVDWGDGASVPIVDDGLDIKKVDSQFPSGEYGNFKDAILRAISLSLGYGVNFITIGNNLEKVNYSSARQGLLSERDSWKLLQKLMVETLIEPIFEAWIDVEHLSGRLGTIVDNQYQEILDKIRYQPRSWAWIDPVKDAKGVTQNLSNKTISLSEAILESGRDPDEVLEQIAKDNEKLKDLNITEQGAANENTKPTK